MAMITWQIRQLLTLQDALRSGRGASSAGVRMPRWKLQAAERALRAQPLNPVETLETLARANQLMNSHRAGTRRVFEGVLLELCASR